MFIELTRQNKSVFVNSDHITEIGLSEYGWTLVTLCDYKVEVDQAPIDIMDALQGSHQIRTWDKEKKRYVYYSKEN